MTKPIIVVKMPCKLLCHLSKRIFLALPAYQRFWLLITIATMLALHLFYSQVVSIIHGLPSMLIIYFPIINLQS